MVRKDLGQKGLWTGRTLDRKDYGREGLWTGLTYRVLVTQLHDVVVIEY